jgi:phosphate transport system substrate-binding protein
MKTPYLALVLAASLFTTSAFAENISVHGSTSFVSTIMNPHRADIEKDSGLTLDVVGNGSGNGLMDLAQGKADVAMLSDKLEDIAAKTNTKTPGAIDVAAYKAFEIAKTHIAFTVYPGNPVKELTREQIADILGGKTTNWKTVGGDDKEIVVVTEGSTGGLRTTAEKKLLSGASIAANKKELVNAAMIGKYVAQAPEALGIMAASAVNASVRELNLDKPDEITLYYVTRGAPSPSAQKLIDSTLKYAK